MSDQMQILWLMYIDVVEIYSNAHEQDRKQVMKLFKKYHVYEKIEEQYEYFHQMDISEAVLFAEELVNAKNECITVYHGTDAEILSIDLKKSKDKRDFGIGFYCTLLQQNQQPDFVSYRKSN